MGRIIRFLKKGGRITRVTSKLREAQREVRFINTSFRKRGIKREAFVCRVSQAFVKRLTRRGFPIPKKNFGVCIRDKR